MNLKKCFECGLIFEVENSNRKYCSYSCKISNYRRKHNIVSKVYDKKCKKCGCEFTANRKNRIYCSKECSKKEVTNIICIYCGKEHTNTKRPKFCNETCRNNYYLDKNKKTKIKKECIICNKPFEVSDSRIICCSKECSKIRARNKAREYGMTDEWKQSFKEYQKSEKAKEKRRIKNKERRAKNGRTDKHSKRFKKLGLKYDRNISLKKLIEKDNNICHICGQTCDLTDFTETENTIICGDNYPSIDHVIPASKGGTHTWDNVKLAHRKCNYIKSDKLVKYEENGQARLYI